MKGLWTIYKWGEDPDDKIARFLQNGGVVEQAIGMFEVTPKLVTIENRRAINVWWVRA